MIDAIHAEQVQRLVNVFGWAFLARVSDSLEPEFGSPCKDILEEVRGVAHFGRVEPDTADPVQERHRLLQCCQGVVFVEVPEETHDQAVADAEFGRRLAAIRSMYAHVSARRPGIVGGDDWYRSLRYSLDPSDLRGWTVS